MPRSWFRTVGLLLVAALLAVARPATAAELVVVSRGPAQQPFGDRLQVHSNALQQDMIVTVTPPLSGLPKEGKAAAIYALDEGYGVAGPAGSAMAGAGVIAPSIVVAVGWMPGQWNLRDEDLLYGETTYDQRAFHGRGERFEAFLLDELKPYIETHYPVDPQRAVLVGHSSGGLFAAEILARRPESFAAYVIASPPLWQRPEAMEHFRQAVLKAPAKRVYLAVGGAETPTMVAASDRLADALQAPGSRLTVRTQVYAGARHPAYFTPLFADSFPWVLPPEPPPVPEVPLRALDGRYRMQDGRVLTITARADQLFAAAEGYAQRELRPLGGTGFGLPDLGLRLRFTGDGDGVTMTRGGVETTGARIP